MAGRESFVANVERFPPAVGVRNGLNKLKNMTIGPGFGISYRTNPEGMVGHIPGLGAE
jgi:hypothetical protein